MAKFSLAWRARPALSGPTALAVLVFREWSTAGPRMPPLRVVFEPMSSGERGKDAVAAERSSCPCTLSACPLVRKAASIADLTTRACVS